MTEKTRIGLVLAMIFIVGFGMLLTEMRKPEEPIDVENEVSLDNGYTATNLPEPTVHPRPAVRPDVRRHRPVARRYTPAPQQQITPVRPVTRETQHRPQVAQQPRPRINLNMESATIRSVSRQPAPHREMDVNEFAQNISQPRRRQPVAKATYYTVQRGDNLRKIARHTLKDSRAWRKIYQANKDKLSSPDMIDVGMKLKIPNGI